VSGRRLVAALAVVFALAAVACSKPTGLVVHVESDFPRSQFGKLAAVRLTLRYGATDAPLVDQIYYNMPGNADYPIPGNITVYAHDPEESRPLWVTIETGLALDGTPRPDGVQIREQFVVTLRPHHMIQLDAYLDSECANRVCLEHQTCGPRGTCVSDDPGQMDFMDDGGIDVMTFDVPLMYSDGGGAEADMDAPADAGPGADVVSEPATTDAVDVATHDVTMDVAVDAGGDVHVTGVDGGLDVTAMDVALDVGTDAPRDVLADVAGDLTLADAGCRGATPNQCGSVCTSVGTDPLNCGACGHVCPEANACSGGGCIQLSCSSLASHCPGNAPGACSSAAGATCASGCATGVCNVLYPCVAPYGAAAYVFACCRSGLPCTGTEVQPTGTTYCCSR
jgi:hypothetical protein